MKHCITPTVNNRLNKKLLGKGVGNKASIGVRHRKALRYLGNTTSRKALKAPEDNWQVLRALITPDLEGTDTSAGTDTHTHTQFIGKKVNPTCLQNGYYETLEKIQSR